MGLRLGSANDRPPRTALPTGGPGRHLISLVIVLGVLLAGTLPPTISSCDDRAASCSCCAQGRCSCGPDGSCGCRGHVQAAAGGSVSPVALVPPLAFSRSLLAAPADSGVFESVVPRAPRFALPETESPPPKRPATTAA